MNSIDAALNDVLPYLSGSFPQSLKQLTGRLYAASKRIQLRPQEEVARHHLCALVAINQDLAQLNTTAPSLDSVPLPPKVAKELFQTFTRELGGPVTPTAKRLRDELTPMGSPSPSPIAWPTKKRMGRPPKAKNPFMDKPIAATATITTTNTQVTETHEPLEPTMHPLLSISQSVIALCNKFQLDITTTSHILATFHSYSDKVSKEWILICGLVLNCYYTIHHRLMSEVGRRAKVEAAMFNLQQGQLLRSDIGKSVEIVRGFIGHARWFKNLKLEHGLKEQYKSYDSMLVGYKFASSL